MRKRTLLVILPVLLILSACGQPVPQEKAAYVGEWRAQAMALLLTQDGTVAYKRLRGGVRPVSTARCAGSRATTSSLAFPFCPPRSRCRTHPTRRRGGEDGRRRRGAYPGSVAPALRPCPPARAGAGRGGCRRATP